MSINGPEGGDFTPKEEQVGDGTKEEVEEPRHRYLNVDKVLELGQPVPGVVSRSQPQIPPGNQLVAHLRQLSIKQMAVDVTDPGAYDWWYQQYDSGRYTGMNLYLVPTEKIEECEEN